MVPVFFSSAYSLFDRPPPQMSSTCRDTGSAPRRWRTPWCRTRPAPRPPSSASRTRSKGTPPLCAPLFERSDALRDRQGIFCYCCLKEGFLRSEDLFIELRMSVRRHIGPFATPDALVVVSA